MLETRHEDRDPLRLVGVGDPPAHLVAPALDPQQVLELVARQVEIGEVEVDPLAEDPLDGIQVLLRVEDVRAVVGEERARAPPPDLCGPGSDTTRVGGRAHVGSPSFACKSAMHAWRAVRPLRVPRSSAKRSTRASSSAAGRREPELARVVVRDPQIRLLIEGEERQQQSEAIRQRDLLFGRLAGVQQPFGVEHRLAVLGDPLGQQVAAVRGGEYQRVRGSRLETAVELGLEPLPARVALFEREVVAEHAEALGPPAQNRPERRQVHQVVAPHLDQPEARDAELAQQPAHRRRLPGAALAVEQHVERGPARGEGRDVRAQPRDRALDPDQARQRVHIGRVRPPVDGERLLESASVGASGLGEQPIAAPSQSVSGFRAIGLELQAASRPRATRRDQADQDPDEDDRRRPPSGSSSARSRRRARRRPRAPGCARAGPRAPRAARSAG